MQETFSPPHWLVQALQTLVTLAAGGGILKLYNLWLNRRKPAADVEETEARALEIRIRSQASATDSILKMMDRLDRAQSLILQSETECRRLQGIEKECARLREENEALQDKVERYKDTIRKIETGLP